MGCLFLDYALENFGNGQRLKLNVGLGQYRSISAQCKRGAEHILAFSGAASDSDHLRGQAFLLEAYCLFDANLIEGIQAHLHAGQVDTRAITFHANFDVVVNHSLYSYKDFHLVFLLHDLQVPSGQRRRSRRL
ncbi:hypothetical protein D9M68_671810 [compost metagenome]